MTKEKVGVESGNWFLLVTELMNVQGWEKEKPVAVVESIEVAKQRIAERHAGDQYRFYGEKIRDYYTREIEPNGKVKSSRLHLAQLDHTGIDWS